MRGCIVITGVVFDVSNVQCIGEVDVPSVSMYIVASSWLLRLSPRFFHLSLLRLPSPKCEPFCKLVRDIMCCARYCKAAGLFEVQHERMLLRIESCRPSMNWPFNMYLWYTIWQRRASARSNSVYLIRVLFNG